jgi:glycosyltransferase involved in cell wall biosynthesis
MPFFTVVIPAFNRARLIEHTLQTVLSQEFRDYEILCVDDGSTDGTLDVLGRYADRVEVLQQNHAGPGGARNCAIERARGEYVAFLDSDDLWFEWSLAMYHDAIRRHAPGLLVGRWETFAEPAELASARRQPLQTDAQPNYFASRTRMSWIGVSGFVVRSDLLRAAQGFATEAPTHEDADLMLRLGLAPGFVRVLAPVTYGYRRHADNSVLNWPNLYAGAAYIIQQEKQGRYPGGKDTRIVRRRILTNHVRPASIALLRAGYIDLAWQLYRNTIRWHLQETRLRYLAAFPALACAAMLRTGLRWRRLPESKHAANTAA